MRSHLIAVLLALFAFVAMAAVEVNKASVAELDSVKGVGPTLSGKIVEARKKGDFKDWSDLIARVSGIGEKSAAKLSEAGLTVNGQPYMTVAASKTAAKNEADAAEMPAKAEFGKKAKRAAAAASAAKK